jgi:hypothetical protein
VRERACACVRVCHVFECLFVCACVHVCHVFECLFVCACHGYGYGYGYGVYYLNYAGENPPPRTLPSPSGMGHPGWGCVLCVRVCVCASGPIREGGTARPLVRGSHLLLLFPRVLAAEYSQAFQQLALQRAACDGFLSQSSISTSERR